MAFLTRRVPTPRPTHPGSTTLGHTAWLEVTGAWPPGSDSRGCLSGRPRPVAPLFLESPGVPGDRKQMASALGVVGRRPEGAGRAGRCARARTFSFLLPLERPIGLRGAAAGRPVPGAASPRCWGAPPREGARASAAAPRHRAKREPRAPGSCGPVTTVTATGRVPGARGQGRPGSEVLRTASWPHGPCSSGSGVHSDPGDLLPGTARCHPESPPSTTRPLPPPWGCGEQRQGMGSTWEVRGLGPHRKRPPPCVHPIPGRPCWDKDS